MVISGTRINITPQFFTRPEKVLVEHDTLSASAFLFESGDATGGDDRSHIPRNHTVCAVSIDRTGHRRIISKTCNLAAGPYLWPLTTR